MRYYIYFDTYDHAKAVVDENELKEKFNGDPEKFFKIILGDRFQANGKQPAGRIVRLTFENKKELEQYLEQYGEVIRGFYDCDSDSRPYNF